MQPELKAPANLRSPWARTGEQTKAARLWRELWHHPEAMGLARNVHRSVREPSFVDRMTLTDWGSDPANWDD